MPIRNEKCSETHKSKHCSILKKCVKCGAGQKGFKHVCDGDFKWCKNCNLAVENEHKCFLLPESNKLKNKKFDGYIFFDFETYEDEKSKKHVVNLAMAQKICNLCLDLEEPKRCDECKKQHIFYNITDYCNWAFLQPHTIQIAHNLKGFDGVFILNHIYLQNKKERLQKFYTMVVKL